VIAALLIIAHLGGHTLSSARYRLRGWTINVTYDRFTHETQCTLAKNRMSVDGSTLIFQFKASLDTADAWYRLGSAPPQPWRALIPDLMASGIKVRSDDLLNPSQGRIPIPLGMLSREPLVQIQSGPRNAPASFSIAGLFDAIAAANAQGCRFQGRSSA
jgi:hypothetical protein